MMNLYFIQHKLKTPARQFSVGEVEFDGFEFLPWDLENPAHSGDWIVQKKIKANTYNEAMKKFIEALVPILDGISVISQCASTLVGNTHLAYKTKNNVEQFVFIRVCAPKDTIGMPVEMHDMDDLKKLINGNVNEALFYLRLANNSMTVETNIAMLMIATESLAGTIEVKNKCEKCGFEKTRGGTDPEKLNKILGEDLHKELYRKHGSLRNRMFHGSKIDESKYVPIRQQLHNALIDYLVKTFDLKYLRQIKKSPRGFYSFESVPGGNLIQNVSGIPIDMRTMEDEIYNLIKNNESESRNFKIVASPPKSY